MVKKIFSNIYIWIILLLVYAPILWLMAFSFTSSKTIGTWTGFSLDLYVKMFQNTSMMEALKNTLILGISSAVISTFIGTFAAIGIYNMKNRSKKVVKAINQIPILNADIVTAVSLMILFVTVFNVQRGLLTALLAHITFCTPYVILNVLPRLHQTNNNLYEAALDLGATPTQALFKVVIPEVLPGMVSGFLLAFTLSIDDFAVTVFNIGSANTLSTYIYKSLTKTSQPIELRALFTVIIIIIATILIFNNIKSAKKAKEMK